MTPKETQGREAMTDYWDIARSPSDDCPMRPWDLKLDGYLTPDKCLFYYDGPIVWLQDGRFMVVSLNDTAGTWDKIAKTTVVSNGAHPITFKSDEWLYLVTELDDKSRDVLSRDGDLLDYLDNGLLRKGRGVWIVLVAGTGQRKASWRVRYDEIHGDLLPFNGAP